jgi:hypothetical protein
MFAPCSQQIQVNAFSVTCCGFHLLVRIFRPIRRIDFYPEYLFPKRGFRLEDMPLQPKLMVHQMRLNSCF